MKNEEIRKKLFEVISNTLELENISQYITQEGVFADINIDSITYIKVVIAIEDQFGIEFDDDMLDFEQFNSVDVLVHYISENIKE